MKQKTGRKLLSFLLTLAMVVGLLPGMSLKARAATNTYTNLIPTDSDTDLSAKQVTFNGIKWYIIKDDSTSETTGTVTLLAADKIDKRNYATQNKTIYNDSSVKEYLDGLTAENGSFEAVANAIESTDLIDVDVRGAKLYLLSFDEANTLPKNIRNIGIQWWLRTNIEEYNAFNAEYVGKTGDMTSGAANIPLSCDTSLNSFGVRPVLKLKLDSVNYSDKSFTVPTVAVTNVSLNTNAATLTVGGDAVALTAAVDPNNATDKKVKWSVGGTDAGAVKLYTTEACETEVGADATDALTVYAKGISAGSATVTVTSNADGDKSASCDVTVNAAASTNTATILLDDTRYQESPTDVGTITSGDITITTDKGSNSNPPRYYTSGNAVRFYAKNTFTVSAGGNKITKIEFTDESSGNTNEITANPGSLDGSTWTGSADSVTFTIGGASGHRKISAIKVTYEKSAASSVAVTGITLSQTEASMTVGGTLTLTPTVLPDNATDKTVKWSVGGTDAGAVKLYTDEACETEVGADATETLTVYAKGISAGSATVTCTSNADSTKSASCDVTVNEAASDDPYASLVNTTTVVNFDGKDWYLIENNSTALNAGTVTLLSKECVAASQYNSSGSCVEYASSTVKTAVDNWYNNNITSNAKTAVFDNKMFLLTKDQANAMTNAEVRKCSRFSGTADNCWWLCSPGRDDSYAACVYGEDGYVSGNGRSVGSTYGVRPALKLNLSSSHLNHKHSRWDRCLRIPFPIWHGMKPKRSW